MSERIYARLLKLFPSGFHKSYGEDALQLFRDRARDETGLVPRIRLWLDLLADLAISVPREYFYAQPELVSASPRGLSGGTPSFYFLTESAPRPGALLLGTMLSLTALVIFSTLLGYGGSHRPMTSYARRFAQRSAPARSSPSARPTPQSANAKNATSASEGDSATSAPQKWPASASAADDSNATGSRSNASTPRPSPQPAPPFSAHSQPSANPAQTDAAAPPSPAPVQNSPFDAAERHRVVAAAADNIRRLYVHPEVGRQMSDALLAHENRGDDNAATDGSAFATLLTRQMRDVSHDLHLDVVFSVEPLRVPRDGQAPAPEELARYRQAMQQQNCTFEKVEVLPHNIGYFKLNSFPDPAVCQSAATAAMRRLNGADALIFDLRDNRGGFPDMVMFLAAYLFDHPEYMYSPRENTSERSWTRSPVPGNTLAGKPVFILISRATYSAAEHFSYDLKMLKRATLVGETTGGAAHSGVFHRLDDHFGIGIPEADPINPFGKSDWAVVGVAPDVRVSAADALATARKLVAAKLAKR
jgi:hypothetical protein